MRDRKSFRLHLGLLCATALALVAPPALPQSQAKTTDWPSYAADLAGTRYRPLDQINASNFNDLEIGASRRTILAIAPNINSKARHSWSTAFSTRQPARVAP